MYFSITSKNKSFSLSGSDKNEGRIIVSLTSFPLRIGRLWLVIETILRQTKKPDKIILWLSKDQFPRLDILPKKLMKQMDRGLEIRLVNEDIRSHKKYYYTLIEFPIDYLLTIDDDILYRSTMVEDLFNYSNINPLSIISQYSREIKWQEGKPKSYALWPIIQKETPPNHYSFFGSGGGTLFPSFCLDSEVLNKDLFMRLAPTADDVWLNAMCRLKGTKIVSTSYYSLNLPVINKSDVTLDSINNGLDLNDVQITSIRNHFKDQRQTDPFQESS
jgi:hypothetical protein